MIPEALFNLLLPLALGWFGFSWRRTEQAISNVQRVADKVDQVELKMAEQYLTKRDFEIGIERLFAGFERLEQKVDFHVYNQGQRIRELKSRIETLDDE